VIDSSPTAAACFRGVDELGFGSLDHRGTHIGELPVSQASAVFRAVILRRNDPLAVRTPFTWDSAFRKVPLEDEQVTGFPTHSHETTYIWITHHMGKCTLWNGHDVFVFANMNAAKRHTDSVLECHMASSSGVFGGVLSVWRNGGSNKI
jgi:hypothetical protein